MLEGQTAIVTGGSRGIGRAISTELAKKGANVIIAYASREEAAMETLELCKQVAVSADQQFITVKCNVAQSSDIDRLFDETMEKFGRIDVLVNNAGVTRDNILLRMSEEEFDTVIETNLRGTYLCMKKVSRQMLRQKYGRIINISSIVGLRGNPGQVNYSASKAGVIGMTKSLAKEMASKNITVNAVAPGMIDTEMADAMNETAKETMKKTIPAGRMGNPKDVANAVVFFAEPESDYITGQVICVDGGMAV